MLSPQTSRRDQLCRKRVVGSLIVGSHDRRSLQSPPPPPAPQCITTRRLSLGQKRRYRWNTTALTRYDGGKKKRKRKKRRFINSEGQSQKSESTNHNLSEDKGEPKLNRAKVLLLTRLMNTLPLGQPAHIVTADDNTWLHVPLSMAHIAWLVIVDDTSDYMPVLMTHISWCVTVDETHGLTCHCWWHITLLSLLITHMNLRVTGHGTQHFALMTHIAARATVDDTHNNNK